MTPKITKYSFNFMRLKIVYIVVCGSESLYIEQAFASIWSLKYYNPDVSVTLVMDDNTIEVYKNRDYPDLNNLIDEIITIPFPNEIDNHTRSRWLKTNLRNLINGNYLFLDTDTIITGNISDIAKFNGIIGAVPDGHRVVAQDNLYPFIEKWMLKYFSNIPILPNLNYYNSGVMFVNDCPEAYKFYELWHTNWRLSQSKGFKFDQLPLFATDNELGGVISPINDNFNYQVSETIKYLYSSKILHFYNGDKNEQLHPFFGNAWLKEIKTLKRLSESTIQSIINCKELFNIKSKAIGGDDVLIWKSALSRTLQNIGPNSISFKLMNFLPRTYHWLIRTLK